MEQLIPLLVQLIGGAAGGNVVGALLKNANLSALLRTILGVVGGVGGGQLAALLPALQGLLGAQAPAGGMLGNAGVAAGGGALLTFIVGLIKQAMDKSKS